MNAFANKLDFTNDYIFVSYSHEDFSIIQHDKDCFDGSMVNYWCDDELHVGDNWFERVQKVIFDNKCKGAIIYFSKSYLVSEAAEKEIGLIKQKISEDSTFSVVLISVDGNTVLKDVCEIFANLSGKNSKEIENKFPQQRLSTMVSFLNKDIIFLNPLSLGDEKNHNTFLKTLREKIPTVFNDQIAFIQKLSSLFPVHQYDEIDTISFGYAPYEFIDNDDILFGEGWMGNGDQLKFVHCKKAYSAKLIEWKVLSSDENETVLLSPFALSFGSKNSLDEIVKNELKIPNSVLDALKEVSLFDVNKLNDKPKLLDEKLIYTRFAKDKNISNNLDVFIVKENDKIIGMTIDKRALTFMMDQNSQGYLYLCLKLDTQRLIKLGGSMND